MASAHLVNGPCAFSNPIAAGIVKIFDYVNCTNPHPHSLVAWLILHHHIHAAIAFGQWLINDCDGIASCAFKSFGLIESIIELNGDSLVNFAKNPLLRRRCFGKLL